MTDVIEIYGEIGSKRTALDMRYCVEITDGALNLDLLSYRPFTYGAIISALKLTEVTPGSCKHSIYDRLFDVWYKPSAPWTYAVACANSVYVSASNISMSPDWGYWFDKIDDGYGTKLIGWSGNVGYAECGISIDCNYLTWQMKKSDCICGEIKNTVDDWLFYRRRTGSGYFCGNSSRWLYRARHCCRQTSAVQVSSERERLVSCRCGE